MRGVIIALALGGLTTLAACVEPTPPAQPPDDADQCKASSYGGLIGQSQTVLKSMMLPAGSRVIGPNDAVTMDFRADRLNIEIGAGGRIEKIACY
ncbi:MAG: hypothetical protein DI498_02735 [Paracoccus denitrificans]|nr:MAG: hypothetical protein DI498_02735 [Paracoccus denitrificans]PZO85458.1 MAG: hypothetical protein DI633_02735 [Paracoccus denitrificans]